MNGLEVLVRGGIKTPPFPGQERSDAVYEIAEALWLAKAHEPVVNRQYYDEDPASMAIDDLTRSGKEPGHACTEVAEVIRRAFPELAP